jgi:hypothetical protein
MFNSLVQVSWPETHICVKSPFRFGDSERVTRAGLIVLFVTNQLEGMLLARHAPKY